MRACLLTFVATALYVAAAPKPQVIDYDALVEIYPTFAATGAPLAVTATATTVPFNAATASAAAAAVTIGDVGETQPTVVPGASIDDGSSARKRAILKKRDGNCSVQKTISSYTLDAASTVNDFYSQYGSLASASSFSDGFNSYGVATKADGTTPWINLQGAANAPGYLGYTAQKTYDPPACLAACEKQAASAKVGNKCVAFNLYVERDPSLDTNAVSCPNPAPITNVKCVFYSQALSPESAKNTGQWRNKFQVAIASSSAYNKVTAPLTVSGFAAPAALAGAINAPLDAANGNVDTYMGTASFTTADPNNCAKACDEKTAYEKSYWARTDPYHSYQSCNYFNYYILSKNGVPVQQVCSFYSAAWDPSYAVNTGYSSGGNTYTISSSAGYSKPTAARTDLGKIAPFSAIPASDFATRYDDTPAYTYLRTYQGFTFFANDILVWKPYNNYFALQKGAKSTFATCNAWQVCTIRMPGSTLDIVSIDLADLQQIAGPVTVTGQRNGVDVITRVFNLPGNKFVQVTDFAGFTNLDALRVTGPTSSSVPAYQSIVYIAHKLPTKRAVPVSALISARQDAETVTVNVSNGTEIVVPASCSPLDALLGTC